jgi:7-cyano-7-deazaguanine synthase
MNTPSSVLVLASGGLDSSACIAYYKRKGYSVNALWVNYGQPASIRELKAVQAIALHYDVQLQQILLNGVSWTVRESSDEIIGRNLLLASIGASSFQKSNGLIAMGLHAGVDYYDCSKNFMQQLSAIVQTVSNGRLDMDFPFKDWQKQDIVNFSEAIGVPLDDTYSCIKGTQMPCGECSSCLDRNHWERAVRATAKGL